MYAGFEVLNWIHPINKVSIDIGAKYNIIGEDYQKRELHKQFEPYNILSVEVAVDSLKDRYNLRQFFLSREGRVEPFFLPSFHQDILITRDIKYGDTELYFEYGYEDLVLNNGVSFIYVVETESIHRIVSVTQVFDDVLNLLLTKIVLDTAIQADISKDCSLIQMAYLVRFKEDSLTFNMNTVNYGTSNLSFEECSIPERKKIFGVV